MGKLKLPCPHGVECKRGPNNTAWFTKYCDERLAKYLLEQHLQYVHPVHAAAPGQAPVPVEVKVLEPTPEVTSDSDQQIEELTLHDEEGNNAFRYAKKKTEYKCLECADQDFTDRKNFKEHLKRDHLLDVDLSKSNHERKPFIKKKKSHSENGNVIINHVKEDFSGLKI